MGLEETVAIARVEQASNFRNLELDQRKFFRSSRLRCATACAPGTHWFSPTDRAIPLRPYQGGVRQVPFGEAPLVAGGTQERRSLDLRAAQNVHDLEWLQERIVRAVFVL